MSEITLTASRPDGTYVGHFGDPAMPYHFIPDLPDTWTQAQEWLGANPAPPPDPMLPVHQPVPPSTSMVDGFHFRTALLSMGEYQQVRNWFTGIKRALFESKPTFDLDSPDLLAALGAAAVNLTDLKAQIEIVKAADTL